MKNNSLTQLQFSNTCSNPNTIFSEKYKKQFTINKQGDNNKIKIIYNSCSCKK